MKSAHLASFTLPDSLPAIIASGIASTAHHKRSPADLLHLYRTYFAQSSYNIADEKKLKERRDNFQTMVIAAAAYLTVARKFELLPPECTNFFMRLFANEIEKRLEQNDIATGGEENRIAAINAAVRESLGEIIAPHRPPARHMQMAAEQPAPSALQYS